MKYGLSGGSWLLALCALLPLACGGRTPLSTTEERLGDEASLEATESVSDEKPRPRDNIVTETPRPSVIEEPAGPVVINEPTPATPVNPVPPDPVLTPVEPPATNTPATPPVTNTPATPPTLAPPPVVTVEPAPAPAPSVIPSVPTPPEIITCPDATNLGSALGTVATGSNADFDDPFTTNCGSAEGRDTSFIWTAPANGTYQFDTFGSSYDTVLALRVEDNCGDEVDCNDDDGTVESKLLRFLNEGETLAIILDAFSLDHVGDYQLNITQLDEETAEECNALEIGSAVGVISEGSFVDAATEYSAMSLCGGGSRKVGFAWSAPAAGSYTISTAGSDFDTVLDLRVNCVAPTLTCSDDYDGVTSQIVWAFEAGEPIFIELSSYGNIASTPPGSPDAGLQEYYYRLSIDGPTP
jgi:hypothetical protein